MVFRFSCFPVLALLLALPAPAGAAEMSVSFPDLCDITGRVAGLDTVQASPWEDNVPSPFSVTEIRVSVDIESRAPRGKTETPSCRLPKDGGERVMTYKLCSATPVKSGDRIHATEGVPPLGPRGIACLFDVAVVKPEAEL